MDWENTYVMRRQSAAQAVGKLQTDQRVVLGALCSEPQTIVEELVEQRVRFSPLHLYVMALGSSCPYANPAHGEHLRIHTFLSSKALSHAFTAGTANYIPINMSQIPLWLRSHPPDAALVQVSPPNAKGYCSLGISVDYTHEAVKQARLVIAEMNDQMPFTYGHSLVHVKDLDCIVTTSRPLLAVPSGSLNEVERKIGYYVAELISDGSTVQLGIGSVPNGVLAALRGHQRLGVHSGLISDSLIPLMESGVITNEHKQINRGRVSAGSVAGSEQLYCYVDQNPAVSLLPCNVTHDISIIAQIKNFVAINSALEVDLSGQINAERIDGLDVGGVGGQMNFLTGANVSEGGKSIIALPSTNRQGTKSRIVPTISCSVAVTSVKSEVNYVVTEYGAAELFGKSMNERASALVNIAHPQFRESLEKQFHACIGGR